MLILRQWKIRFSARFRFSVFFAVATFHRYFARKRIFFGLRAYKRFSRLFRADFSAVYLRDVRIARSPRYGRFFAVRRGFYQIQNVFFALEQLYLFARYGKIDFSFRLVRRLCAGNAETYRENRRNTRENAENSAFRFVFRVVFYPVFRHTFAVPLFLRRFAPRAA